MAKDGNNSNGTNKKPVPIPKPEPTRGQVVTEGAKPFVQKQKKI